MKIPARVYMQYIINERAMKDFFPKLNFSFNKKQFLVSLKSSARVH